MLHSRCHCKIVFVFLTLISIASIAINAQEGNTTPAKSVSAKKELTPPKKKGRSVDLDKTVSFSLTLDAESKSNIQFDGINRKQVRFTDPTSDKVAEMIKAEFGKENALDGVVLNVAKNVKYPVVNSLFRNVRAAMDEINVSKPIYIAVQDPLASKKVDDQPTTQEFVIKNKKAGELYDRVSNVAKLFKVSVRLDPARNSITAKGPASKVKAIQNLISALDRPAGASVDPNKKIKPIVVEEKNDTSNKNDTNSNPKIGPPQNDNSKSSNSDADSTPRNTRSPNQNSDTTQGPVGKFQMTAVGNNLFLLDTTTGDTWILDPSSERMSWIRLPHPNEK